MARLRNSEWALMIVQRALEIGPKKRHKFLSNLEGFGVLDNKADLEITKRIIKVQLRELEKPKADFRILGKAKYGLTKINDRENVMEKHWWNFISQHQPGDSPGTVKMMFKPIIKYCKRKIKKGKYYYGKERVPSQIDRDIES